MSNNGRCSVENHEKYPEQRYILHNAMFNGILEYFISKQFLHLGTGQYLIIYRGAGPGVLYISVKKMLRPLCREVQKKVL